MADGDFLGQSTHGGREGSALLLIHGLGSSGEDWQPQLHAFGARYAVLAPDLPGHGRSAALSGTCSIASLAAEMAALLDRRGHACADVVGLSLGGAVALQLALDFPRRVRSLTIVNSGPQLLGSRWQTRIRLLQRLAMVRILGLARLGRWLGPRLFPHDLPLQKQFAERFACNDPRSYRIVLRALARWNVSHLVERIACPTLVVGAEHDYTSLADKCAYVERMPNARLVMVPDSHHALPAERPEAFNQVLGNFLDSLVLAPGTPSTPDRQGMRAFPRVASD